MTTNTAKQGTSPMDYARDISEIKVAVQRIESSMVPRAEIEASMKERVTTDVYLADKQSVLERLVKLETNPQRMIAWISAVIGCIGVLIAGASFVLSVVIYLITHR